MLKQYVFVPKYLKMSSGKIASQVAHATFLALEQEKRRLIRRWKDSGMAVIILECTTPQQFLNTEKYLNQWKFIYSAYIDEGSTEIPPMTTTVIATGILDENKQKLFENFNLYTEKKIKKKH